MPVDPHLFSGEGERRRRYGRFLIDPIKKELKVFKHDSFFQEKKFDDLYGDIHREFAPMQPVDYENPFFQKLVLESYKSFPIQSQHLHEPYEVSAHMIRIEATPGSQMGRPAPEGIHRDGYHFGSIHLMTRSNVSGAINNFYDLDKNLIDQKLLEEPMDSIFFNDAAIFHAVSPFEQANPNLKATRDMLILLYQPLSESPQKDSQNVKTIRLFSDY